jgi:hypothetical protein
MSYVATVKYKQREISGLSPIDGGDVRITYFERKAFQFPGNATLDEIFKRIDRSGEDGNGPEIVDIRLFAEGA